MGGPVAFLYGYLATFSPGLQIDAPLIQSSVVSAEERILEPAVEIPVVIYVPKEEKIHREVTFTDETLKRICACESTGSALKEPTHYEKDGVSVLRGRVVSADTGICQINKFYWDAEAKSMGLDLEIKEENIEMANFIYETHGTTPWNASRACWGG